MEGVELHYFTKVETDKFNNNKKGSAIVDQKLSKQHFYSYFSNISLQNAASTNNNMDILLKDLEKNNILILYATLFYNTDGCSKQYSYTVIIYMFSMLAKKYMIDIEHLIETPGHRKGYFDGQISVDKKYLKKIMMLIKSPNEENCDIKKDKYAFSKRRKALFSCRRIC